MQTNEVRVRSGEGAGQGRCEPRNELIVKSAKKSREGGGLGVRVDVKQRIEVFVTKQKKSRGIRVDVNEELKFL